MEEMKAQDQSQEQMQSQETHRREYSFELKLEAVHAFLDDNMTRREVVAAYDIASVSTFKKWVMAYRRYGVAGLAEKTRGGAAGTRKQAPTAFNPLDPEAGYRIRRENQRLASKLGR